MLTLFTRATNKRDICINSDKGCITYIKRLCISESAFKNKASVSLLCEQEKSSNDKLSNADVIFILVIACLFCRRQRYK